MDPAFAVDVVGGSAASMLFAGLLSFDRDGSVVPGLAESYEVSEDGLVLRFRMRPGLAASDGMPVGAEEARASLERLLDPDTASPRAWVLEGIRGGEAFRHGESERVEGLAVTAPGVLQITLDAPRASFPRLLAMPNAGILPAGGVADGSVATGPWVLEERMRDARLVFRRNPHWPGESTGFRKVHVSILPEEFTREAEYETGRIDLLEVPPQASARYGHREEGRLERHVALVTEYVGLNCEDPVLSDARVRRALNHAVHVERILEEILSGRGVRASGAIPPSLPGGGKGTAYAYDPERARSLLREAGVPREWVLELWQRPSPIASQVLQAVQSDLRAVGVRSEIRLRDWSALKASIDGGQTQAFFINWYADYPDPENFLVPLFHSGNVGGGGNRARFRDEAIDTMLDALQRTGGDEERARLAGEIDALVHRQAPWIYLWHPVLEVAVSDRVRGYRPHVISGCERWTGLHLESSP